MAQVHAGQPGAAKQPALQLPCEARVSPAARGFPEAQLVVTSKQRQSPLPVHVMRGPTAANQAADVAHVCCAVNKLKLLGAILDAVLTA